ncbi:MAG: ABC transporter [Clostridia bacterium]|nr:ABC transporter [Clostridia bacterium]
MKAVFLREIKSYYTTITGFLFAAFLLLFAGIYTMAYNLSAGYPNFEYVLSAITIIYLIGVPILTMRAMAEEKKQKTDQLLYSLPLPIYKVVTGKYLALLSVLAAPVAIMCAYPLILTMFGDVYLPSAYCAIIGFFLMGATLLAIGLFISSVTENQITSAVICLITMLLLYFMTALSSFVPSDASSSVLALMILAVAFAVVFYLLTHNSIVAMIVALALAGGLFAGYTFMPSAFEGLFPDMMSAISVFDRFEDFSGGVFNIAGVVYYISVTAVFLFMTVQSMEKRRYGA